MVLNIEEDYILRLGIVFYIRNIVLLGSTTHFLLSVSKRCAAFVAHARTFWKVLALGGSGGFRKSVNNPHNPPSDPNYPHEVRLTLQAVFSRWGILQKSSACM